MTPEELEELEYLLQEYKEKKEQYYELQADVNAIKEKLILVFQSHNIKEREYKDKIFKLYKHICYSYPQSCKKHMKIKPSQKESIKMYDKNYITTRPKTKRML